MSGLTEIWSAALHSDDCTMSIWYPSSGKQLIVWNSQFLWKPSGLCHGDKLSSSSSAGLSLARPGGLMHPPPPEVIFSKTAYKRRRAVPSNLACLWGHHFTFVLKKGSGDLRPGRQVIKEVQCRIQISVILMHPSSYQFGTNFFLTFRMRLDHLVV